MRNISAYKVLIKVMTQKEQEINKTMNGYILNWLKEINIEKKSYRSHSQVVQ